MKKVLALITHGVEEIEAVTPFDLLSRAEIGLTISAIGVSENLLVRGRSGLEIKADVSFETLAPAPNDYATLAEQFDALLIPGGPSSFELLKDGRAAALAAAFHRQGKLIAAICAAPLILNAAGILEGKRVSAHACTWEEIHAAKNCARTETDGNVLTSRGPATAFDFGLALVEALSGKSVAARIAAETMA